MKRKKSLEVVSDTCGEVQPAKKTKHLTGLMFRQKLMGDDPSQAMKLFLEIYREGTSNQDIVLEYLESGGNGEEILLILPSDNKDPEMVISIFSVLECIFLRVMTDLTSYLPDAEETAKCLLQSHLPAIYLLLSAKSSVESKKAVLRLLTVMSTLSGRVAKNILTYLKINSNMMYGLTRYDSPSRPLFIHFVLSFIVEGNPQVVKLLLDKKDYLRSITPGLIYDPAETVEMVLAILQKNVLENPLITKTNKMHAFNSNVLKSFFDLFNWKGPQKAQKKKRKSSDAPLKEVDMCKKVDVQEALYPFLCILCGSTKSGVVFFDPSLGVSGKNQNLLVHKVLEGLEKPWEHSVIAKLLVNIFTACPDLIPTTIHQIVPLLEPRASQKWLEAMEFIGKVIDSAEPGVYLSKPRALLPGQLLSALERILIPKSLLQPLIGSSFADENAGAALFHPEIMVRHCAVQLLNKILKTATKFLEYDGLENYFSSASTANQFCQSFLNILSKALPDVGSIIRIWKQALEDIKSDKGINFDLQCSSAELAYSAACHLRGIVELLLVYAKWWPPLEMGADGGDLEDGWGLLKHQNFLKEIQHFEGLELMVLELLSSIGCLTLSSDQPEGKNFNFAQRTWVKERRHCLLNGNICSQFAKHLIEEDHRSDFKSFTYNSNGEILRHLFCSYAKENEKQNFNPWKNLILTLFLKTGLFEGNEVEASIWVHSFRAWYRERLKKVKGEVLDLEEANVLTDFIALSLNKLIHSPEEYVKVLADLCSNTVLMEGVKAGETNFKSVTQVLNDMMEDDFNHDELLERTFDSLEVRQPSCDFTVSPLLPAALSQAENYPPESEHLSVINNYLDMVIVHILYGQGSPKPLIQLLKVRMSSYSLSKSLEKYIKSWHTQTPHHLGQLLIDGSIFSDYSRPLLDGLKSGNKVPSTVLVSSEAVSDGLDAVLLFRMIVFHVVSMAQQRCLNEETLIMAENMLEQLIHYPSLCEDEENLFLKKSNTKQRSLFSICFLSLFNNSTVLELFEPLGGTDICRRLVTRLVVHFLRFRKYFYKNIGEYDDMCTHFKDKFLHCIVAGLVDLSRHKKETKEWDEGLMDTLFASLSFSSKDVIDLLERIKSIPAAALVNSYSWKLSGPGLVLVKLLKLLCKLKMTTVKLILDAQIFSSLADHVSCIEEIFESSTSTDGCSDALNLLEACMLDTLQVFPHLISSFPKRLFISLVSTKFSRESACKLSHFLIGHSETFSTLFLEYCDSNWNVVSLQFGRLLSHLNCALGVGKESIPDAILTRIFETERETLRNNISSSLDPPLWISDYPQLFKLLVMRVMDDDACFQLYSHLIASADNGSGLPISSLEVLFPVFEKIEKCSSLKLKEKPKVSFLRLMLQSFVKTLKTAAKNESYLSDGSLQTDVSKYLLVTCKLMENSDDCSGETTSETKWRLIKKCGIWKEFSQLALKVGIGQGSSLILKILERICSKVLCVDDPEATVIYKMTILHSKFLEIMLENKPGKVEIIELLVMLIEKNSANKSSSLVPTILSSYGATLSKCDILILKVLKMLDLGDLNFNQFSPFLWGSTAASFFSLKRKAKTTTFSAFSVLRQPKADQVLDLLDINVVMRTIVNFPIHRKLQARDTLELVYAETNVYDPCFYLPILSHILAPENPIKIYKVVQSGALALTVIALGSSDPGVRSAAMHILARFYSHLETGRPSKEKKLWLNFIDSLRNGFALLANSKDLDDVSSLQLPSVVSIFLARSSLVMSDPQHVMFFPLHNYFLAKPALDLDMVPEFFRLFNSSELESRSYRYWILEVLRDGMKSELDFLACLNSGAIKVLLTSFSSVSSDEKSKLLVLETLAAAVKTPSTAYYLVKGHGLLPWIQEIICGSVISHKKEPYVIIGVINLLSYLWLSIADDTSSKLRWLSKGSSSSILISSYILQLFLSLLPKLLCIQLQLADYTRLMVSLLSVSEVFRRFSKSQIGVVQEQDLKNTIALGKKVLNNVNVCEDALEYRHNIFPTSQELLSSYDDTSMEALKSLFKFVTVWQPTERKVL